MSGFIKGHPCQSLLMHLVDKCKLNLKNRVVSGALLTDISKAFDCLSYKVVISKLQVYGFDKNSCMLVASYFTNCLQMVKIGSARSNWSYLNKSAPQGSHFGSFIYNVLFNDLLYVIAD